jgi:hypothetical protein
MRNPVDPANTLNLKSFYRSFFDDLSNKQLGDICNFLKSAEVRQKGENLLKKPKAFTKKDSLALVERVNGLLNQSNACEPENLISLTHCFANLGYKKESLEGLNIRKISQIVGQNFDGFTPKKITDIISGFAKFGCDCADLEIDPTKLSKAINKQVAGFNGGLLTTSLNGLLKMGYLENDALKSSAKKLVKKTETELLKGKITIGGAASLTHSLAKSEMFGELFFLRDSILRNLNPKSELSSEMAFSLLQTQMNCELLHGRKFFEDADIADISNQFDPRSNENNKSDLQTQVENSLPFEHNFSEIPLYRCGEKNVREVDVCLLKDEKIFFIEVDGPTHYATLSNGEITPNFATKQRDKVNKAAIAKMAAQDPQREHYYLTLSYEDISLAKNNLASFLDERIANSERINPEEVVDLRLDSEADLKTPSNEDRKADLVRNVEANPVQKKQGGNNKKPKNTQKNKPQNKKLLPLFQAIDGSGFGPDYARITRLIEEGVDVNETQNGKTPFELASEYLDSKALEALFSAGAIIPSRLSDSRLLELVNLTTRDGKVNLACAIIDEIKNPNKASKGLISVMNSLQPQHSSVDLSPIIGSILKKANPASDDPAFSKALTSFIKSEGDKKPISAEFLKAGICPRLTEVDIPTMVKLSFFLASTNNKEAFKNFFINFIDNAQEIWRAASASERNIDVQSILIGNAITVQSTESIKYVIDKRYLTRQGEEKIDDKEMSKLLVASVSEGNLDLLKYLIEEKGADANRLYGIGHGRKSSLLNLSLSRDNYEIAKYLIVREGTNLELLSQSLLNGVALPPFLLAILVNAPTNIFECLIDKGVNPNELFLGFSFLYYAADHANNEAVHTLISRGANDFNVVYPSRKTPFQVARENGCSPDVIEELINKGAELNNETGSSPSPSPNNPGASKKISSKQTPSHRG